MKYLFSESGRRVLESLSFTRTLYAFDFDGTLAPIVSSPEAAQASDQTAALLKELSAVASVAVISGRSLGDLRTKVNLSGDLLIGNHGLEGLGAEKETIGQAEKTCRDWLAQIRRGWGSLAGDTGTSVEDKIYSLALHYRRSRNRKKARLALFSIIEKLKPSPRLILGKCVMNLIPAGGPHKGVALLETMVRTRHGCAFYIGDDDTDEDVFSLPDQGIISVRVGRKRASQAQFFIHRQSEVNRLLRSLIRLQGSSNPARKRR